MLATIDSMTHKKNKTRYDAKNNETVCGHTDAPSGAGMHLTPKTAMSVELEMLYQMYEDVESLKQAVAELKAALAALAGTSKPSQSPDSTTPPADPSKPAEPVQGTGTVTEVDGNGTAVGQPVTIPGAPPQPVSPGTDTPAGDQAGSALPDAPSPADRSNDAVARAGVDVQAARGRLDK